MIALIPLGVLLFISTHIDDLLLLLSLFAARGIPRTSIVLGQYIGVAVLLGGSLLCAEVAIAVPHHYLRWLGLVPLALGLFRLFERWRSSSSESDDVVATKSTWQTWNVTLLTVAGGGDNIGVYLPLFSTQPLTHRIEIIVIFLLLTGPWCALAHWLAHHPILQAPVRRWGEWLFPIVLLALGLKILASST